MTTVLTRERNLKEFLTPYSRECYLRTQQAMQAAREAPRSDRYNKRLYWARVARRDWHDFLRAQLQNRGRQLQPKQHAKDCEALQRIRVQLQSA